MHFMPVRKLLKMLFVRGVPKKRNRKPLSRQSLDTIPETRRRFSRRWILLMFIILGCFYVIFCYKKAQSMLLIKQYVSRANTIFNKLLIDAYNELPLCEPSVEQNDYKDNYKNNLSIFKLLSEVQMGGYYYPKKCRSRHKVAILVPYRNRERNLAEFVDHMHPFLIKQQLEYRIFIIEQTGEKLFNRGKLFNIGFREIMKYNGWHCVVLHDVDLLPQNDKILYTCPILPRHMVGTVIEKANLTYAQFHTFFGGVSALSVHHYKQINGFSNLYWGWGGEDNDMYWRILSTRLPMLRYSKNEALYKSLPHAEQHRNNHRYKLLKFAVARYKIDGLSSLVYNVIWTQYRPLYTHIRADVNPLKENITDLYSKLFR